MGFGACVFRSGRGVGRVAPQRPAPRPRPRPFDRPIRLPRRTYDCVGSVWGPRCALRPGKGLFGGRPARPRPGARHRGWDHRVRSREREVRGWEGVQPGPAPQAAGGRPCGHGGAVDRLQIDPKASWVKGRGRPPAAIGRRAPTQHGRAAVSNRLFAWSCPCPWPRSLSPRGLLLLLARERG